MCARKGSDLEGGAGFLVAYASIPGLLQSHAAQVSYDMTMVKGAEGACETH